MPRGAAFRACVTSIRAPRPPRSRPQPRRSVRHFGRQNGGDWCWFGGRMIQQLAKYDLIEDAYRELKAMVSRVVKAGDFHEWWSRDNQPRGSKQFRGSAGVLGKAIEQLLAWAEANAKKEATK